ncbi:MAG: helix-turn-helix domain-containing protein [Candidatus Pacebacteria bacterium]|nr:helix-turn-helix domain-containing protein [Candidatus Paceibacterota bacterium]
MSKSKERIKAIDLRKKGKSIKEIAKDLKVSKSSVSIWCRNVKLTEKQINELHQKMIVGGYKGRIKGAKIQQQRKLTKIEEFKKEGIKEIGKLSKRDLLIAGLSLYLGEGLKKSNVVKISNSNPDIIKFAIDFFKKVWGIKNNRFTLYIGINKIHQNRTNEVEEYWSRITGIPLSQFTKTTLIKSKNKKIYKNFKEHYGTLTIKVRRSADLYYKIQGLIDAILIAGE